MKDKAIVVSESLRLDLDPAVMENMARQTGFMKRFRKIQPVHFIETFLALTFNTVFSLRVCAIVLGLLACTVVSKVALFKKLTSRAVDFMSHVLFYLLAKTSQLHQEVDKGVFSPFRRVLLNDSTNISLPSKLAQVFPGAKNQSGKTSASLKLQTTYEVLTETFVSFRLTLYSCNDQCASPLILEILEKGDLILRDLGYFSLKVFRSICAKGAFYLTRYWHKVALYAPDGERFDLLGHLQRHGSLDQRLLAGAKERLPVRVVAIPVPDHIAAERRRKLLQDQKRDRRLHPSKTQLALLGWEIFITNVEEKVWDTETTCRIYGIRWRIEIVFKSWKSHFHINAFQYPTANEVKLLIYSRLIFITLFQTHFYEQIATYTYETSGKHLSLLKTAQFFQQQFWLVLFVLRQLHSPSLIIDQILEHCTYEKRKRLNHGQLLHFLTDGSLS